VLSSLNKSNSFAYQLINYSETGPTIDKLAQARSKNRSQFENPTPGPTLPAEKSNHPCERVKQQMRLAGGNPPKTVLQRVSERELIER